MGIENDQKTEKLERLRERESDRDGGTSDCGCGDMQTERQNKQTNGQIQRRKRLSKKGCCFEGKEGSLFGDKNHSKAPSEKCLFYIVFL